jgi:CheY-like chemotaxis protein/HPt (histidine-containing phosphotransfer) domain-containing protein
MAKHLLIVEDDPVNRIVVSAILESGGFTYAQASDGILALEELAREHFDLVLMDWHMPGMDGLEATRKLRSGAAGEANRNVPVIALTANAYAEDRRACFAAGMDDFLTKPVKVAHLLDTVNMWLQKATNAHAAAHLSSADDTQTRLVYDPSALESLPMVADGSDRSYVPKLLRQFAEVATGLVASAEASLAVRDLATLQRSVHSLKSSAAQVGALALADCAARIERELRAGQPPAADAAMRLRSEMERFTAVALAA